MNPANSTPAALPDPETIRRTAQEVVARPDYQLDPVPETGDLFLRLLIRLLGWVIAPFRWLYKSLEGLPEVFRWVIVGGLAIVLVALILHIGFTLVWAIRGRRRTNASIVADPRATRDPAALERQADEAAARDDHIAAVRLLFRACLLRIEQAQQRTFRAGITNREVLQRHRDSPMSDSLKLFVETLESKWYGLGSCGPDDFAACREAYLALTRISNRSAERLAGGRAGDQTARG